MEGAAITQIRIDGISHQFSTIEGAKEDLVEIILNLKKIRIKKHSDDPEVAILKVSGPGNITAKNIEAPSDIEIINKDVSGPGNITAKNIEAPSDIEIINKDQHIATLANKKSNLSIELIIESGVGYSPTEERKSSKVGVVVIDALFSPVIKAHIQIEETRAGGRTDLDKLILTVETDGSIKPSIAVYKSAEILSKFFDVLARWEEAPEEEAVEEDTTPDAAHYEEILVDELPLQTRTINALKKAGVETMAELSQKSVDELSDIKNLGEKSISEINKLLVKEGLREKE